ncbi:MAG: acetyl esterase/lipase [Planctomycetaceae bacterium]|jgi:acetyl esterase/lipase
MTSNTLFVALLLAVGTCSVNAAEPLVIDLWPGEIPGPAAKTDGPERDFTKPDDNLIAGRRIIKLGNVSKPQAHVFQPEASKANGGAVVICPGGGFSILAWDLEGTEVAEWFNKLGFTAIVLKYRVPTRHHGEPGTWEGPVMDTQRALSLTRAHAAVWNLDPARVGVLGFSAGGVAAALAAVKKGQRLYEPLDQADEKSCAADFAMLIYPGGTIEKDGSLKAEYSVDQDTPPMFFVHAADDRVTCLSSVALFTALKKSGVSAELHIYSSGGHGYGLRPTEFPVTQWPERAETWLSQMKLSSAVER